MRCPAEVQPKARPASAVLLRRKISRLATAAEGTSAAPGVGGADVLRLRVTQGGVGSPPSAQSTRSFSGQGKRPATPAIAHDSAEIASSIGHCRSAYRIIRPYFRTFGGNLSSGGQCRPEYSEGSGRQ